MLYQLETTAVIDQRITGNTCLVMVGLGESAVNHHQFAVGLDGVLARLHMHGNVAVDDMAVATKNVTDMSYMFSDFKFLPNINVSNFDTKNVTNMSGMFLGCSTMQNINLYNFYTENVTDISNMFAGNIVLQKINLFNFDTSNVIHMEDMFEICFELLIKNIITKDKNIIDEFLKRKN